MFSVYTKAGEQWKGGLRDHIMLHTSGLVSRSMVVRLGLGLESWDTVCIESLNEGSSNSRILDRESVHEHSSASGSEQMALGVFGLWV